MFTGVVKGAFIVGHIAESTGLNGITVSLSPSLLESIEKLASIAMNGCCLIVVVFDQETVSFDVMQEALRVTNLGAQAEGQEVNIERAARFGDEIGEHLLSGHIHDVVEVVDIVHEPNNATVFLSLILAGRLI